MSPIAGTYGQRLYNYLKKSGFCKVVALADQNYAELNKQGMQVISPENISDYVFDDIVIACSFAKTRQKIYADLIKKYTKEKVHVMDETLIKSKSTLAAFGLL